MGSEDSPEAVASSLTPGSLIGKYTVLRLLAVGGSAEVYLVRSSGIEGFAKLAVLKRLLPHLAGHPDFVEMFLDEARLAASLHHPNIAQIYDFGRSGPSHYLTMEYVAGESLANVIRSAAKKKRGFSLGNSLRVVESVAAGLHYAHQLKDGEGRPLGIVHRDVSPHNVMLTFDGSVRLVDFGIATARSTKSQSLRGSIQGSLRYMSPEQCAGEPLDCRSDVFSLGVLLFELTTGTRLHRDRDDHDVLRAILHEPIPLPSTRRKDYPSELERIVMTALAREPSRRYRTAQELQVELESFGQARGLLSSNVALAEYMREIFGERADQVPLAVPVPGGPAEAVDPDESAEQGASRPSRSAPLPPPTPVGRSGWLRVAGGLALAGLLGIGLLRLTTGGRQAARADAGGPLLPDSAQTASRPRAAQRLAEPSPSFRATTASGPAQPPEPLASAPSATPDSGASSSEPLPLPPRRTRTPGPSPAQRRRNASLDAGGMVPASSAPTASTKPSAPWTLDSPLPP